MMYFKEGPASNRMPESHCPECKEKLDGAISLDDPAAPGPGDVSICAYCGEILEFAEDMILVRITPEVWEDLALYTKTELMQIQEKIRTTGKPFV